MESEIHYRRVGLFLISALVITALGLIWFSNLFANDGRNNFVILFEEQSLDGLQKESIVTMKGIKIGVVEDYYILESNIQKVKVIIALDENVPIKTDSKAVIKRNLLTGLAKIDIVGGTQDAPLLEAKSRYDLPSIPEGIGEFAKIADSVPSVLEKFEDTITRINLVLSDKNIESFSQTINGFGGLANELSKLAPKIKNTIENLEAISLSSKEFTDKNLKDSNKDSLLNKINATLTNLEAMSQSLRSATSDAENITKSTSRSIINMQQSLKSIADDFQTLSDSYGNPNQILNESSIPENNHE